MSFSRLTAPHLAALYQKAASVYGDLPAFATRRRRKQWEPLSFRELYDRGAALATALMDLGVDVRQPVGLLGENRREWIEADYAVQLCGAYDVPRGADVTDNEIAFILHHSGSRVTFVETPDLARRVLRIRGQGRVEDLEHLVLMTGRWGGDGPVHHWDDLVERGQQAREAGDRRVEERVDQVKPDDLFTLIYTSGTTGEPKGVMLTHANMISQVETIPLDISPTDRVLSLLPVWHIFERVFEMLSISCGGCTYYTSVRHLADDMVDVEPTFMGSAPRLWESLHERILKRVRQAHPVRRALFYTARWLSRHYHHSLTYLRNQHLRLSPEPPWRRALFCPVHALRWLLLLPWYGFFNAAVLEPIRLVAGGSLKGTVSGGGALPREVDLFFNTIGIQVLEGYGLTETTPVLAVRTPSKPIIGTVGPLIRDTRLRIVSPGDGRVLYPDPSAPGEGRGRVGEIVVRGPQVMKGYYRNRKATEQAIRNGWFHTGDLGCFTTNDCLAITGRFKETIVLRSGENVEPGPIEMRLRQSQWIDQCIVVGQDQPWLAALIVPKNHEELDAPGSRQELEKRIEWDIREMISSAHGFKPRERIRDFVVLDDPFEVGEELTNLHKLKRHVVLERHAKTIEAIYLRKGTHSDVE